MNGYYKITFYLTNACLGEISSNFRRIYWVLEGLTIKVYFYLHEQALEDMDSIEDIMSNFDSSVEEDVDISMYSTDFKIIYGGEKYLDCNKLGFFAEIFRRKGE